MNSTRALFVHILFIAGILIISGCTSLLNSVKNLGHTNPSAEQAKVIKPKIPSAPGPDGPIRGSGDKPSSVEKIPEIDKTPKVEEAPETRSAETILPREAPAPAPPASEPPSRSGKKKRSKSVNLPHKDEVNEAAVAFANNLVGVEHIKTCYSKQYGGWYLLLYIQKQKKWSIQQFSWNAETKEWEYIYQKDLEPDQVEFHVKVEVSDETCFVWNKEKKRWEVI